MIKLCIDYIKLIQLFIFILFFNMTSQLPLWGQDKNGANISFLCIANIVYKIKSLSNNIA